MSPFYLVDTARLRARDQVRTTTDEAQGSLLADFLIWLQRIVGR
jgi:hypothetical protein